MRGIDIPQGKEKQPLYEGSLMWLVIRVCELLIFRVAFPQRSVHIARCKQLILGSFTMQFIIKKKRMLLNSRLPKKL